MIFNEKNLLWIGLSLVTIVHVAYVARQKKKEKEEQKKDSITINLPEWAIEYYNTLKDKNFKTKEEMMKVAIELSSKNVKYSTGGPFGCAIYEYDIITKVTKLFSIGVNRVVPLHNSTLHGEMIAIQYAQYKNKNFTLNNTKQTKKEYYLYTSCEPCCMCLGGIFWSGCSQLVCSATKHDAESIGFNEGPVFKESYKQLEEQTGCKVIRNILQQDGAQVLKDYVTNTNNLIYNA